MRKEDRRDHRKMLNLPEDHFGNQGRASFQRTKKKAREISAIKALIRIKW